MLKEAQIESELSHDLQLSLMGHSVNEMPIISIDEIHSQQSAHSTWSSRSRVGVFLCT